MAASRVISPRSFFLPQTQTSPKRTYVIELGKLRKGIAMLTARQLLLRLLGLTLSLLALTPAASAQSLTWVGDFSNMTVGTVRPIYAVGVGSWNFPDGIDVADFPSVNGGAYWATSDGLGFSLSPSGPFLPQLDNVSLPLDYWGNGTTQTIYMKALTPTSAVQVGGCGSTVTCGVTTFFSISGTQPPPPNPNPAPTVGAIAVGDVVAYWLVTPSPVAAEFRNSTIRFTITPNSQLGAAKSSTSSTWGAAIGVDMTFDAAGNGRTPNFYLKGRLKSSGTTSISASSDNHFAVASQTIPMSVSNITFFEWVPYSNAYPLDANPNSGGGLRLFADKNSPYETDNAQPWRLAGLKVRISPAVAGMNVRLKIFDVDDPSSDNAVDPNGSSGNDNRAGTVGMTANLITNANGEAVLYYTISSQPGDNYRAAAVLSSLPITSGTVARQLLDSVTIDGIGFSSSSGDVQYATSTNSSPATLVGSPMLTVWRRLHIERDSMGIVTNNRVSGSFYRVQDYGEISGLWAFDLEAGSTPLTPNRFAGGHLVFQETSTSTPRIFTVVSNSSTQVRVNKGKGSPFDINFSVDTFKLYDDDDFNRSNPAGSGWSASAAGDEGEQIPQPDVSFMQDSDELTLNIFTRAYIRPKYDLAGENAHLPFVRNTAGDATRFDNIAHVNDPDFWVVYLLNAYQSYEEDDNDPNNGEFETIADLIQGASSALVFFVETRTDLENEFMAAGNPIPAHLAELGYVAHYTARLFGAEVGDGGIMGDNTGYCTGSCLSFTGVSLNKMRSALHP